MRWGNPSSIGYQRQQQQTGQVGVGWEIRLQKQQSDGIIVDFDYNENSSWKLAVVGLKLSSTDSTHHGTDSLSEVLCVCCCSTWADSLLLLIPDIKCSFRTHFNWSQQQEEMKVEEEENIAGAKLYFGIEDWPIAINPIRHWSLGVCVCMYVNVWEVSVSVCVCQWRWSWVEVGDTVKSVYRSS